MASIHQVILDGRLSQLNLLINKIGCNINEKDSYGRTPLHLAVLSDLENFGYRVASLLLQSNADINATDFQQQTPLIYACLLNRSKLIPLFLQTKSIDWYHIDYEGYLILHHTASSSKTSILVDIIHEMQSIGLSIDCKTGLGYTPLILAIKSFRFDNAIYLLDHTNASPFVSDDEYHLTCQQWTQNVGLKLNEWIYYYNRQNSTLKKPKNIPNNNKYFHGIESSHHMKSSDENTSSSAILSPRNKDRKSFSLSAIIHTEKTNLKPSYQMWMELVQRLNDRTSSIDDHHSLRQEKSWNYNEKLNSNNQVLTLINHYSSILTADNNKPSPLRFNDRPKSILRSRGSMHKHRLIKKVTFDIN